MKAKVFLALIVLVLSAPMSASALTAERWAQIKRHFDESAKQAEYSPNVGDKCFVVENDVAWTTEAEGKKWAHVLNSEINRLNPGLVQINMPSDDFLEAAVKASNGGLIKLDPGVRVTVVEGKGNLKGQGFEGGTGKIQITTGTNSGKVCFTSGMTLNNYYSEQTDSFFKTKEEKDANSALFVSKYRPKDLSTALMEHGVTIEAAASLAQSASSEVCRPREADLREFNGPGLKLGLGMTLDSFLQNASLVGYFKPYEVQAPSDLPESRLFQEDKYEISVCGLGNGRSARFLFEPIDGKLVLAVVRTVVAERIPKFLAASEFKGRVGLMSKFYGPVTQSHEQQSLDGVITDIDTAIWQTNKFNLRLRGYCLPDQKNHIFTADITRGTGDKSPPCFQ